MEKIVEEISNNLDTLNLSIENKILSEKIILMAINSIKDFIKFEINPFIEFSLIKDTFINLVIGQYLELIKNSNLQHNFNLEKAVKTIKEGDTSITYFEKGNVSLDDIIQYFLSKKSLLYNFKKVVW